MVTDPLSSPITKQEIAAYIKPLAPRPTQIEPSGGLAGRIRCVLFDIYGTLFISGSGDIGVARQTRFEADRLQLLLDRFGLPGKPAEVRAGLLAEIERQHAVKRRSGIDTPEVNIDTIWMTVLGFSAREKARRFAVAYEWLVNPCYPMPGLSRLLARLKRMGITMGLISNAQFYTPLLFDWFLGDSPQQLGFDPQLLFFSYRCRYAKPSRFMLRSARRRLEQSGIPPQAAVYVGNDMLNDIYTTKQEGFQTALFAGDARSLRLRSDDPRCRDLTPDLVLTELDQLLDHL